MARIDIKVVPNASRSTIAGWLESELKVRVTAPPEKGKANKAVVALIAEALDIPAGDVEVIAGHRSPRKTISVAGLTTEALRSRLSASIRART